MNISEYSLDRLASGTPRQRSAAAALRELDLFAILEAYSPVLAGTVPIDVDIPSSDLDVICEAGDLERFLRETEANFAHLDGYSSRRHLSQELPSVTVSFRWKDWAFELFAQPREAVRQNACRHMVAEGRLLKLSGAEARSAIRRLKEQGMKTEPAFARHFRLSGDPYARLLELADAGDEELQAIVEARMDWGLEGSLEKRKMVEQTETYVKEQLKDDFSGHDWFHISRVARTADAIGEEEQANRFVCRLAALLHDLADDKLRDGEEAGLREVGDWLERLQADEGTIAATLEIISTISYKGGGRPPMATLEGQVVQDADRLDAIGAVGIARVFAYSGAVGRPIHDPGFSPRAALTPEEYRGGEGTAIAHFYEKLLKLKDGMNTTAGRRLAAERHAFMLEYLEQFYGEWDGRR